jgi:hypothetical protein
VANGYPGLIVLIAPSRLRLDDVAETTCRIAAFGFIISDHLAAPFVNHHQPEAPNYFGNIRH